MEAIVNNSAKKRRMPKVLKIILIVVGSLIAVAGIALGVYLYSNTHYYQADWNAALKLTGGEKQATLPSGAVINYAETPANGKKPLLLIHGQTGNWQSYSKVLPTLAENWHVYAIDVYGHGKSSHDENLYYLDVNGDDIIWFINNIIGEPTVVAGHSNGALTAGYVAAYGGDAVCGCVLEDPPVFSTEPDYFEKSFAYVDTYKVMHEYMQTDMSECWASYYFKNCYWGKLYMKPDLMEKFAKMAQDYRDKNPGKPVEVAMLPGSITEVFLTMDMYDMRYGERFYDYTWHHGISHEKLMSDINVPTVYIHAKEGFTPDGILMCAASEEQAKRAVELIGAECSYVETKDSQHLIHEVYPDVYVEAVNSLG